MRSTRTPLLALLLLALPGRAGADLTQLTVAQNRPDTLAGLDLNLTLWEISGLDTAPGAYTNQLVWIFEPRFKIGKRLFRGTWAERLVVAGRFLVENELVGSDPFYRGAHFASPALLRDVPEQVAIAQQTDPSATPYGLTDGGTTRRTVTSDLWLSLIHDKLLTLPTVDIALQAGARVVLPTSLESQIAGLIAAPSLYLGLEKRLGRFTVAYGFRAIKYFYSASTAPIRNLGGTVLVNGQNVEPLAIRSTGRMNPDFGFLNFLSIAVELPKNFTVEADYFLFSVFANQPAGCSVEGVPTANLCTDGLVLGDVRRPAERDSSWFLLEVEWRPVPWAGIGVGVSTFMPIRLPNGELAQPFVRVNRDNYSTLFLSLSVNAEALATAIKFRGTP